MKDLNVEREDIKAMFTAGAHFGYSKTRRHPSAKKFIFGQKNKVDIIDLEKTADMLASAKEFIKGLAMGGKVVLFVGTKPEAKASVLMAAESIGMPSVTERWVGGIITNFPEIKKRVARLIDLTAKKEAGELDKYTKKERLLIDIEVAKMEKNFSGIIAMKKIPDALVVIDSKKEHIAVTEARKSGIPVIALVNTDCDMGDIDYPIIANDASTSSVSYFINELKGAYKI